MANTSKISSFK